MSVIFLFVAHSKAEMLSIHLNDILIMLESTQIASSSLKKLTYCMMIA